MKPNFKTSILKLLCCLLLISFNSCNEDYLDELENDSINRTIQLKQKNDSINRTIQLNQKNDSIIVQSEKECEGWNCTRYN